MSNNPQGFASPSFNIRQQLNSPVKEFQGFQQNFSVAPPLIQNKPSTSISSASSKPISPYNGSGTASLDPSKVKDKDFLKHVSYNFEAFNNYINEDPRAKDTLNSLLMNYGVISVDDADDMNGLALPDPTYVIRIAEEALAIFISFKDYLRRLLEKIDENLAKADMKLVILVKRLKSHHDHLTSVIANHKNSNSTSLRDQYATEIIFISEEVEKLSVAFEKTLMWKKTITNGVATNF